MWTVKLCIVCMVYLVGACVSNMDVLISVDSVCSCVAALCRQIKLERVLAFSSMASVHTLKYLHEQACVCDPLRVCLSNDVCSPTCSDLHYQSTSSRSHCILHSTIEVSCPRALPPSPMRQMEPDGSK